MADPRDLSFREQVQYGFGGPQRFMETQKLWQEKTWRDEHKAWSAQAEQTFQRLDAEAEVLNTQYEEMLKAGDSFTAEELFKVRQLADEQVAKVATSKMDFLANAAATSANPLIQQQAQGAISGFMQRMEQAQAQTQQILGQFESAIAADEQQAGAAQGRQQSAEAHAQEMESTDIAQAGMQQQQQLAGEAGVRAEEQHELGQVRDLTAGRREQFELDAEREQYQAQKTMQGMQLGAAALKDLEALNIPEDRHDDLMLKITNGQFTAGEVRDRWGQIEESRKKEMTELRDQLRRAETRGDREAAQLFEAELKDLEAQDAEKKAEELRFRQVRKKGGRLAQIIYGYRNAWEKIASPAQVAGDIREAAGAEVRPKPRERRESRETASAEKYGRDLY